MPAIACRRHNAYMSCNKAAYPLLFRCEILSRDLLVLTQCIWKMSHFYESLVHAPSYLFIGKYFIKCTYAYVYNKCTNSTFNLFEVYVIYHIVICFLLKKLTAASSLPYTFIFLGWCFNTYIPQEWMFLLQSFFLLLI